MIFVVDSEGVLTVIKAVYRTTIAGGMVKQSENVEMKGDSVNNVTDIEGLESEPKIMPDIV